MTLTPMTELENQREAVLQQMRSIRSMKRGTINEQYLKVPQKGSKPAMRGPYYVLSRREGNKTVSERLSTPAQIEEAKSDVAAHKKFTELCKEFEVLTERMGALQRKADDSEWKKKRLKRQSKLTEK